MAHKGGAPDPGQAATPAEFVAAMRGLKEWSGLTYRQLSARAEQAGDFLPHSTLASVLARNTLPREDVVAGLVRACGGDDEAVADWLLARHGIATGSRNVSEPGAEPPAEAASGGESTDDRATLSGVDRLLGPLGKLLVPAAVRIRVGGIAVVVVLAGAVAGAVAVVGDGGPQDHSPTGAAPSGRTPERSAPPSGMSARRPPEGRVLIRAAHTGMCLTEGRERNGNTDRPLAVQRDCSLVAKVPPTTRLERVTDGVYRVQWYHPTQGVGCLTVDKGGREDGRLLQPLTCVDDQSQQHFFFEPVDAPKAGGYRIRPMHSGKCLGFLDPMREEGAEVMQTSCVGSAEQEFLIGAQ
jgi:hypothetical protein